MFRAPCVPGPERDRTYPGENWTVSFVEFCPVQKRDGPAPEARQQVELTIFPESKTYAAATVEPELTNSPSCLSRFEEGAGRFVLSISGLLSHTRNILQECKFLVRPGASVPGCAVPRIERKSFVAAATPFAASGNFFVPA